MMNRVKYRNRFLLLATHRITKSFVVTTICFACIAAPTFGQGNGQNQGGKKGEPVYEIVDLLGPYHELNGNSSQTSADMISDVAADGTHHVVGVFRGPDRNGYPCIWSVAVDGSYVVEDLTGIVDPFSNGADVLNDVNSAGIIAGSKNNRPALYLADGTISYLAEPTFTGAVRALTSPNSDGLCCIVGFIDGPETPFEPVLWEADVNGNILSTKSLAFVEEYYFLANDIRPNGLMAGNLVNTVYQTRFPAIAWFDTNGELVVSSRQNPYVDQLEVFQDLAVDDAGNLLGTGLPYNITPSSDFKPVIWPIDGPLIDLEFVLGTDFIDAKGIAFVNGQMQVVGTMPFENKRGVERSGFLYEGGAVVDLQTISTGEGVWDFFDTTGISDVGAICGAGIVGRKRMSQSHGYVLMPRLP